MEVKIEDDRDKAGDLRNLKIKNLKKKGRTRSLKPRVVA